jgi:hypothetical protein
MTAYLKVRIDMVTNQHVHCSLFEGEGEEGSFTYARNGGLVFSREMFYVFKDCLMRGRGGRTVVTFEDRDMAERLDWEAANKSQS